MRRGGFAKEGKIWTKIFDRGRARDVYGRCKRILSLWYFSLIDVVKPTGTVDLILKEKKNVLYVPSALVFDMGSKKVVYIEGKEGVKETREVTTGEQIQNEIEITGGLKENEQILTN